MIIRKTFREILLISVIMAILSYGIFGCNLNTDAQSTAEQDTYAVTVYAGPSDVNVDFFKCGGFDENGYDILGEKLTVTDNGVNSDYHTYSMSLAEGTYSFRATDSLGNSLGGMTFDVPAKAEVDNLDSKTSEIYLRQVDVYTTTKIDGIYANETQYTTEAYDSDGNRATPGKAYADSSSRTRYPYVINANGNATLYTFRLIPTDDVSQTCSLGVNTITNQAIAKGTTILTKSGNLPTLIDAVINAPSESEVRVFSQIRNFCTEEVMYKSKTDENGISSYTYRLPKGNGNHTYRVSMDGKITKAGYLKLTSEDTAKTDITFADEEDPKIRPQYDRSTAPGSRMEDNILLNINPQNYLRMNIGDSFKARAYRAWQIVNSDTSNIMIEPDFDYKVISGDSITVENQNQNAVIKAVKDGISIVEVTYDAIEIGGNTNYKGIYGAIDPVRKGMFVVNVGGDTDTVINLPKWDSDFDTVYFAEEKGTYNFKPTSSDALNVKCNNTEIPSNEDGSYTLPIEQGNNIVSVTAGNTTEYVIIKGKKVTVNVENSTSPGEEIKEGDTVAISFDGLHMPMPKFSGIYNPGFGGTVRTSYKTQKGLPVQSRGTQYDFICNHTISMTVYESGEVCLTGGNITLTSMGFVPGSHRELTDEGVGANFNASSVTAGFSQLPDISIEVMKNNDLSYIEEARRNYCNLSKVSIICAASSYQKSFMFNLSNEASASKKNSTATFTSFNKEYPLTVCVNPVNDVYMELRYREFGDTDKKKAELIAGEELHLDNPFSGEKPIYMEIAVTPKNPLFGGEKVYSYVVYKTSQDFPKPILKTLNVKDTEGNSYALYSGNDSGISYTETDYVCYIPSDMTEAVISLARLNGTADVTIGEETRSVKTSETEFNPVPIQDTETTVSIVAADGGVYNIRFVKLDKITGKKIANDKDKAVVSFISPADKTLVLCLADNSSAEHSKINIEKKAVTSGENTVCFSLSEFEGEDSVSLFVWDEKLCPVFDKTNIVLE